ncbi:thiamine ABC transporter ATP-binding protein [Kouleothrix aurantiaca]|jgi:raffinose/stachyose/melibiose transport system permease protein|uniref:Thiamine ABC transporter ATP-binding protein n=1 Tax=Kouleothrix aurantiaca TaxID=186479 RepID=A0A0P9F803_9CHLR|nr:thiamine ABC transporter ATP-binding protein [Kouleothrix aurantiaca]
MAAQQIRASAPASRTIVPLLQYLIGGFVALLVLIPLVATVINGFKTNADLLTNPFGLPERWEFSNYSSVLQNPSFWRQMGNSTLVMLGTALGVLIVASMAAFVFARLQFRGREILFNFFTLGLLFPIAVAILPLYITLRQANLVDSLWGIILPQVAFGLPGNILILRGFFASIPRELDEAAAIDGCSPVGFFWRVLLPLMRPALAAVAVLTMVGSWNNFFLPLLVLNSERLYTLPLGIMQFQGQFGTDWGRVLSFVSLALVPTIVFYLLAERQIIAGLTAGAVKG